MAKAFGVKRGDQCVLVDHADQAVFVVDHGNLPVALDGHQRDEFGDMAVWGSRRIRKK